VWCGLSLIQLSSGGWTTHGDPPAPAHHLSFVAVGSGHVRLLMLSSLPNLPLSLPHSAYTIPWCNVRLDALFIKISSIFGPLLN